MEANKKPSVSKSRSAGLWAAVIYPRITVWQVRSTIPGVDEAGNRRRLSTRDRSLTDKSNFKKILNESMRVSHHRQAPTVNS
jgi:hypothetical protein